MKTNVDFQGVFALLLTPFHEDGSIDWAAYDAYVDWQLAQEPQGLFAVCGSSEMKWLTLDERLELTRRAVERAGTVPVVSTSNLADEPATHSEEIKRMADTGLAGVVLVPPNGLGEDQDRLFEYFAGLVDGSRVPALIYEWPTNTPHLVAPKVFGDLVAHHGLRGIKDTTCTLEGICSKIDRSSGATVFQANAPYFLDSIERGAGGIMAIVTTAAADLTVAFWRAAVRKKLGAETSGTADAKAAALQEQLVLLDCALGRGGGYPATAKYLAALRGVAMGTSVRAPAAPAAETYRAVELWLSHARRDGVIP